MKNESKRSLFSAFILASSLVAISVAADDKPCKEIRAACEAGGFTKGGHKNENKGLFKDCLQKILAGETVAGVTVTPEQVAGCKAKKEKKKSKTAE